VVYVVVSAIPVHGTDRAWPYVN